MFNQNAVSYAVQAYSGESGAELIFLADFIGVFLQITKSDVVVVLFATWKTSTRLYIHTHWLKDAHTHTGKMQDHKTTRKLLGNFNSSFCFSFIPLCVFSVMWMVVSFGLYNCVYSVGYLSFEFCLFVISFGLWLLLCWRRAQHVQKCMYLTQSKKMVLQYVQL